MATAITVRAMLAMILENNLKMDDTIDFRLSDETEEVLGAVYDIDFVRNYVLGMELNDGKLRKELMLVFDLNDITDHEDDCKDRIEDMKEGLK